MKRLLLALLLLPALAQAAPLQGIQLAATVTPGSASPTWSWQAPTACFDGSPMTPDPVKGGGCPVIKYTLYTGLQGATKTAFGSVGPTTLSLTAPNTPPGIWCGQVTASSAAPVNPESTQSNEACITIANPAAPLTKPGAPAGVTVTLTTTTTIAYVPVLGNDRLTFLIVGAVPIGTACDATQRSGPFYVIPRATVTFDGPAKPTTVVGACGA